MEYLIWYPAYNSIFDYLGAVVYNLYNSIIPSSWRVRIVCVLCVCCYSIYSRRHTCGRTSRGHTGGRSHKISLLSFCGACLNFYRLEGSAVPFPRRLYNNIFSTGAAMVFNNINSNKGTTAHRNTHDTLWASGDAQIDASTLFFLSLTCPLLATIYFVGYFFVGFFCLLSLYFFSPKLFPI